MSEIQAYPMRWCKRCDGSRPHDGGACLAHKARAQECPRCGRFIELRPGNRVPAGHYNPANPPIRWAWENCPGPTNEQKAYAARMSRLAR